jgi:hypothetical protein
MVALELKVSHTLSQARLAAAGCEAPRSVALDRTHWLVGCRGKEKARNECTGHAHLEHAIFFVPPTAKILQLYQSISERKLPDPNYCARLQPRTFVRQFQPFAFCQSLRKQLRIGGKRLGISTDVLLAPHPNHLYFGNVENRCFLNHKFSGPHLCT